MRLAPELLEEPGAGRELEAAHHRRDRAEERGGRARDRVTLEECRVVDPHLHDGACRHGVRALTPDAMRLLIASGADPHAVTELGYNAFHAAIDVDFEANAEDVDAFMRDGVAMLAQLHREGVVLGTA